MDRPAPTPGAVEFRDVKGFLGSCGVLLRKRFRNLRLGFGLVSAETEVRVGVQEL